MRRTLLSALVALTFFVGGGIAHADYFIPGFTLKNNSQCVGGTLLLQYGDVQDTGAAISAKPLATLDCQNLMTGPGQCCSVQYRRATPQPPAIGSHVFMYEVYQGGTIAESVPPAGTLTSSFQRWAGDGTGGACTPETNNDVWHTGTVSETAVFNERLGTNYNCSLWAQQEGFTYWNQSTIYRAGENDPYDVVCTGIVGTPTGTVAKPRVSNTPGVATGSYHEFRSGKVCAAPPAALTASLVANPSSILEGEQSLLTWSSTGAVSCDSNNFNTGGATSGSVVVSPSVTTQYKVNCSGAVAQTTTAATTVNHSEADAYNSQAVIADMSAHGGINLPAVQGNSGFAPDQTTMNRVCVLIDGAGATASNIGARNYNSPGNNAVISYNGSTWVRTGGVSSHMSTSFTCTKPGSSVSTAGPTATAVATVAVSRPEVPDESLAVSCRAHPTRAGIGEDVLWSSTVTGPVGTYTYAWSGTDGLSGTGNEVLKKYTTSGQKNGSLTVTYTPGTTNVTSGGTGAGGAGTCLNDGEEVPAGHLCSAGGLGTIEWSSCCSGVARTYCPAPNEPAEAYCVAKARGAGGTTANPPPSTAACPSVGWVTPITACAGSWQPTYTSGCQSGWQCTPVATTGGGGGVNILPVDNSFLDGLRNLLNFESTPVNTIPDIQTVDQEVRADPGGTLGATATTVNHTEADAYNSQAVIADMQANGGINLPSVQGNTGFGAEQITMNRVCVDIHGAGATAGTWGARGYNSPGNNGIVRFNGTTWTRAGAGSFNSHLSASFTCIVPADPVPPPTQCPAGQTAVPTINYGGGSCSGGTEIAKQAELLDAVQIGQLPDGWVANTCSEMGAQNGDCCEYSQRASLNTGGGFPPNSYWQVRVVRGGSVAQAESTYVTGVAMCNGLNQSYSCSSVAGTIGSQCTGTPPPPPPPPPPVPQPQTVTVQCESGVFIGAPQCSDGIDNDGDGRIDYPVDPGCSSPDDNDEVDGHGGQCFDDIDNDGDGRVDENDSDCYTGSGTFDPDGSEGSGDDDDNNGAAQCSDGIDNNGDGNVDYPDDPGCSSANDNLEAAEAGDLQLSAAPPIIKKGQSCTINLSARNVTSCSLNGPGISKGYTASGGIVSASQVVTPALSQSSTYKLSCNGTNGKVTSKSVDCKVAPTFEEF